MMMEFPLAGNAVAIMVASGFEETEMTEPQRALLKAGAGLKTISPDQGLVNGWHGKAWGHFFPVDRPVGGVLGADFDMLLLPGGHRSVAKLAENPHCRRIISHFLDAGKPIAAVGMGVSLLAIEQKLRGRAVTGPAEIQDRLQESGARWCEEPVVVDGSLITAEGQDHLVQFVESILRVFGEVSQLKKAA